MDSVSKGLMVFGLIFLAVFLTLAVRNSSEEEACARELLADEYIEPKRIIILDTYEYKPSARSTHYPQAFVVCIYGRKFIMLGRDGVPDTSTIEQVMGRRGMAEMCSER